MLEPWRSRYLRAIGVEIYLPRHVLPGAAPSPVLEWDESADAMPAAVIGNAISTIAQEHGTQHQSVKKDRAIPTVDLDLSMPRKLSLEPSPRPAITPPPTTTPTAKIRLLVAIASPGILIIDELPSQQKAHTDTLRLLNNLLFAIGCRDAALQHELFEWPLPNLRNRQIDRDENAGRETLTGFLNKKIHEAAINTVFLLGDAAQFWVSQAQRQSLQGNQLLSWKSSVSAQSVLRDAVLKRQWWQDLRCPEITH